MFYKRKLYLLGFGHQGHFRKLGVPPLTRKKSSTLDGCSRYFKRDGFYSRVWSRMAETDMKEVLKPFHQRASEAEVRRKSICYKFVFFWILRKNKEKKIETMRFLIRKFSKQPNCSFPFDICLYDYTML